MQIINTIITAIILLKNKGLKVRYSSFISLTAAVIFFSACSTYNIESENSDENTAAVSFRFRESTSGGQAETKYPVSIYCISTDILSVISRDFSEDEPLIMNLQSGEYSINAFCGLSKDEFSISKDFEQRPLIEMKNGCTSSLPLMMAYTHMEIQKATEINLVPEYIVTSVELELTNIPDAVKSIRASISPVCKYYSIIGMEHDEEITADIAFSRNGSSWSSGVHYLFPSGSATTNLCISMDYGEETKSYSYNIKKELECGTPYSFNGQFIPDDENPNEENPDEENPDEENPDEEGSLSMDGEFEISGWNMKEEISITLNDGSTNEEEEGGNSQIEDDEENENSEEDGDSEKTEEDNDNNQNNDNDNEVDDDSIETFYVNEIPSEFDIFGPFFIWKSEEISSTEALVTVIAKMQWSEVLAGDALSTLESFSVNDITGWRMFTEEEAREFFVDFDGGESEINNILYENGFNIFYSQDIKDNEKAARYLCNDAQSTFNLYGALRIIKAGQKTEYYLRPVKTMRFKVK